MMRRKINLVASMTAFIIGALFVFSDGASVTANVIGASGSDAGFLAILGVAMIIGAIGLFAVSMNSTDDHSIDVERLLRQTKHHQNLNEDNYDDADIEIHSKKH